MVLLYQVSTVICGSVRHDCQLTRCRVDSDVWGPNFVPSRPCTRGTERHRNIEQARILPRNFLIQTGFPNNVSFSQSVCQSVSHQSLPTSGLSLKTTLLFGSWRKRDVNLLHKSFSPTPPRNDFFPFLLVVLVALRSRFLSSML